MSESGHRQARPGLFRWLTVGVASYSSWLVFNLVLAAMFPAFLLVGVFLGRGRRMAFARMFAFFLRIFFIHHLSFIRVCRFVELPDRRRIAADGPRVLVANHRSWLDALLILALVPGAVVPVNAAYTKVPLLGRAMIWLGCVPLDRASRESVTSGIAEIRGALSRKETIAGFPEGRRSADRRLRPFSDILFRLAIEAGAPVVPVVIHADLPYLTPAKGTLLTARRADWRIRVLDAVHPQKGDRGADLGRRVQKTMARELGRLDSND